MCFYLCDVKMCVFCKKRKRNAAKVLNAVKNMRQVPFCVMKIRGKNEDAGECVQRKPCLPL